MDEAHETSGVTVEVLGTIDLGGKIEGMDGRQLGRTPAVEISVDIVRQA